MRPPRRSRSRLKIRPSTAAPDKYNRLVITDPTYAAGVTYTIEITARYDTDLSVAAVDDPSTTGVNEAGGDATATNDDLDGVKTATVTLTVPSVTPSENAYQVDSAKVVSGEIISAVGNPRDTNPLGYTVANFGDSSWSVAAASGVTDVQFEKSGSNKVVVKAGKNNLAGLTDNNTAVVTIKGDDVDLDDITTDNNITHNITANVSTVNPIYFVNTTNNVMPPTGSDYIYTVNIPKTTKSGTGILPFIVKAGTVAGTPPTLTEAIVANEEYTGVVRALTEGSAGLFRVDNQNMAIDYVGATGALVAGGEHELSLTASGSAGFANRNIVGKVKITVVDVNEAPTTDLPDADNDGKHELELSWKESATASGNLIAAGAKLCDNAESAPCTAPSTSYSFGSEVTNEDGDVLTYAATNTTFAVDETTGALSIKTGQNIARTALISGNGVPTSKNNATTWKYTTAVRTAGEIKSGTTYGTTCEWTSDSYSIPTGKTEAERTNAEKAADLNSANAYCQAQPVYFRGIEVEIDDGVPANAITLDLTVKVLPNLPAMVAGTLPASVAANTTEDYVDYDVTATATQGSFYAKLIDLDDLFTNGGDDSSTDGLNYTKKAVVNPSATPTANFPMADLSINSDNGELQLTNVAPPPPGSDTLERIVRIDVEDGFMDNTGTTADPEMPDVSVVLKITITVETPQLGSLPRITVDENTAVGTTVGSVAGIVDGDDMSAAITYVMEGEVNNRDSDNNRLYEIDRANGDVKVGVQIDHEDMPITENLTLLHIAVQKAGTTGPIGRVAVSLSVNDLNEAPEIASDAPATATVTEQGKPDRAVMSGGAAVVITATDQDAADNGADYSLDPDDKFAIDASGNLTVKGTAALESGEVYNLTVTATDKRDTSLTDTHMVAVTVTDVNEAPMFTNPTGEELTIDRPETHGTDSTKGTRVGDTIVTFTATDPDANETLKFSIRDEADKTYFSIDEDSGVLTLAKAMDYETKQQLEAHVVVTDHAGLSDRVKLIVNIKNLNDNKPVFGAGASPNQPVQENTARNTPLGGVGAYSATDADGDTISYSLDGPHKDSFHIDANGTLMTLEALDADGGAAAQPCGGVVCDITVLAKDGENEPTKQPVTITILNADDSVSSFSVSKANPIADISTVDDPDTKDIDEGDDAMSALADGKTTENKSVPESPENLPANTGSVLDTFVTADWANWGTVLRIEVTAQSPAATCGNGNQCVYVDVEGDESGHKLTLAAYRSTEMDNLFVAAVKVVKKGQGTVATGAVYKHNGSGVAQLEAEEEDEIEIRLAGSKIAPITVQVENEAPEFDNFMPEHEAAYDEGDVDYTFTITDSVSGIPEPEDLPDNDGNSDYMPLVALVSGEPVPYR